MGLFGTLAAFRRMSSDPGTNANPRVRYIYTDLVLEMVIAKVEVGLLKWV